MPNDEKTIDEDFSAELYILEDMGIDSDKLKNVKNKASALKIIEYMEGKAKKAEPEPKKEPKINKKMLNVGGKNDIDLPDPETLDDDIRKNMGDLLKPMRAIHFMNSRWLQSARLMRVYTDEYPEGRVL